MKIIVAIIATIALFIGALLSFLPMGTIPLLPIIIGLILVLINIYILKSQHKYSKILAIIGVILTVIVLGKVILFKDEVEKDLQFEKEKIESQKEDLQDLEDLEDL